MGVLASIDLNAGLARCECCVQDDESQIHKANKSLILLLASAGNNTARKTACSEEPIAQVATQISVSLMKA